MLNAGGREYEHPETDAADCEARAGFPCGDDPVLHGPALEQQPVGRVGNEEPGSGGTSCAEGGRRAVAMESGGRDIAGGKAMKQTTMRVEGYRSESGSGEETVSGSGEETVSGSGE